MTIPKMPTAREVLGVPERRSVELALVFAEMARKDLSASKVLYERKLYPAAIFELEQSVEKAVKAVGLMLGLARPIKEDLTHDVGHATIFGVLVRLPERLARLRRTLGMLAASEELGEGKELIMRLGLPWAFPGPSEMEAKLAEEQTAKAEVSRMRNLVPRDLWKITLEFNPRRPPNPAILKLLREAEAQWKPLDRFQRIFERKFASRMTEGETVRYIVNIYGKAFPEVPPLALVTMWHERETRYPPIDNSDYWNPKLYNARSGLVKLYPRLAEHAQRLCEGGIAGAKAASVL